MDTAVTPPPIPRQFLARLLTLGCPHCINHDFHATMPWFFMDQDQYANALAKKSHLRCEKEGCGELFAAADAILSVGDSRFVWPLDRRKQRLRHLWVGISCPLCMGPTPERRERRYIDVWGPIFLRNKNRGLRYECPCCKVAVPTSDYTLYKRAAEPDLAEQYD